VCIRGFLAVSRQAMHPRTHGLVIALGLALVGCSSKKDAAPKPDPASPASPAGPGSDGNGPGSAAPPERPAPPPAKPLPALAADPGGATGTVELLASFGGVKIDSTRAIAPGPDGSAYVAGYFEDVAQFAPLSKTAAGKSDAFVAQLKSNGEFAWVATVAGPNEDTADALAVGTDGTIGFGGLFSGKIDGGGLLAQSYGSDDMFIAGVSPAGEVLWLWTAGGTASDATTALAATPDGGFIAAVSFAGTARFGETEYESKGADDVALVKLSSAGALEWLTPLGGEGNDQVRRLAVDGNGNVFILGTFKDSIDLGGGAMKAAGGNDLMLARFDASGRHVWSKRIGNPFNEMAGGIAVDRAGNLVITGSYDRDVDFLGTPLVASGESDVFVARLSPDGAPLWVKSYGTEREDVGYGIGVDDAGNAVLTGWFESPINFGGGALVGKGQKDGFIAKLDVDGKHLWSRRFGDWDHDSGNAIAVTPDGAAWLTGIFRYQLDLTASGPTAQQKPGAKLALPDGFIARFSR